MRRWPRAPPAPVSKAGRLKIHAPLIAWTKAAIIQAGTQLGVDYSLTVSCYQADAAGRACGKCDSCRIRRDGFMAAGVPIRRATSEGSGEAAEGREFRQRRAARCAAG